MVEVLVNIDLLDTRTWIPVGIEAAGQATHAGVQHGALQT